MRRLAGSDMSATSGRHHSGSGAGCLPFPAMMSAATRPSSVASMTRRDLSFWAAIRLITRGLGTRVAAPPDGCSFVKESLEI